MHGSSVDFVVHYCGANDPSFIPIIRTAQGQELYRGDRFQGSDALEQAMAAARNAWVTNATGNIIKFKETE